MLARAGPGGHWLVSEAVLAEIREAEAAKHVGLEVGSETLGFGELTQRVRDLEGAVESLMRDRRRLRAELRARSKAP